MAAEHRDEDAREDAGDVCRVRVVARVRAVDADARADGGAREEALARADGARVTLVRRRGGANACELVGFRGACVGAESTQREFYEASGIDVMLEKTMAGYASCVFAYGQTGSGKTYTMLGKRDEARRRSEYDVMAMPREGAHDDDSSRASTDEDDGIIPRALSRVFDAVERARAKDDAFVVRVSYYEIYKEKIIDLLTSSRESTIVNAKPLRVRWRKREGFYIPNLTLRDCRSASEALALVLEGAAKRHVRAHKLNTQSSRSHAILTLHIERTSSDGATALGKMTFVDLAGSERVKASGCDAEGTSETSLINKSLFALGKVISTLADEDRDGRRSTAHVPYRDSKLTKLLMDSLGGRALTLLVACCSPLERHIEETVRTLQYASRAMSIVNTPELVNTRASAAIAEPSRSQDEYERAIDALKAENRALHRQLASTSSTASTSQHDADQRARNHRHSNSTYHTSDVIRRVAKAEALLRSYADENARLERENDALRAERECLALERAHAARDANALRVALNILECTFVHGDA